jgi:hypothetical protein
MVETEIGVNTEVNLYWTGTSATNGFHPHWDNQDVFVLQLQGTKRWRVYEPGPIKLPFGRHKPEDWSNNEALAHAPEAEPILDLELKPGTNSLVVAFVPRYGSSHCVDSASRHSRHSRPPSLHSSLPLSFQFCRHPPFTSQVRCSISHEAILISCRRSLQARTQRMQSTPLSPL